MTTRNTSYIGMLSPDGAWRWDGSDWVPNSPVDQAPGRRMPGQFLPTPVLVAACVLLVLVVFGILAVFAADKADAEAERRVDYLICERWSEPGDPNCN